jgi:hypothetical protein
VSWNVCNGHQHHWLLIKRVRRRREVFLTGNIILAFLARESFVNDIFYCDHVDQQITFMSDYIMRLDVQVSWPILVPNSFVKFPTTIRTRLLQFYVK